MSIACVSCSETLPDGSRFCFKCGAEQTAPSCAVCGVALLPDASFCLSCGTATSASTETAPSPGAPGPVASRRVTSVLFGDLVGFTTLSESRDQEEVRELLSRYFEECRLVIARYGGTVEKFIGDAVMAVWGVPTAHEDDAERAVRAGLELVDAVTSMREAVGVGDLAMRVGVVTGEVAVTVGATQEGMVAGDAVNTAARVQTAATPGQVWVDETTRLLTASAITYLDVGSHAMKGKADPVPLWSVRAVVASRGGAQRADGLEAPLVGRDRELRLCKELFHGTEESRRPRLLVVEGDPGVGKTRLAWEFEKYSDGLEGNVLWHSGRCLAYGEGVAFFALAEAFRGRLRSFDELSDDPDVDGDETALLERGLAALVPDESERAWMRPRVGALLGIGSVGSFPREDLFSAWTTFLERAGAGEDPVVLVIDNAQHADEGLLQFVEHLLAAASFPCFVVLLTRPGLLEDRPALAVNRRATVVHLESLAPADMGSLIGGLVGGLPDDVRDQLVTRSEGIPLYAVETVRSLIDRDLVVPRGGQYVLANGADLGLEALKAPASLQALVAARLDTLTPDQRRIVDRASVLGEVFSRESVAGLSTDTEDVPAVLDSLLRQQILTHETRRFSAELGQYRFVQSVVRQVAYSRLSRRDRKALHLAVAARMEAEEETVDVAAVVAQHYLDAVDAVPADPDADQLRDSAVTHLEAAAARAAGLGGPSEAAAHLSVALSLVSAPDRVAALEARLAEALEQAGRYEEAIRHAERAEELLVGLGDRLAAARAAATRAQAISLGLRDNDAAIAVAEPWWEELKERPDESEVRFLLCSVIITAQSRKGINEWPMMEAQVALAERAGDPLLLCHAYSSVAVYFGFAGSLGLGRVLLRAAADLARDNHDPVSLARTLNNLAADLLIDDLDRAVTLAREGTEVATRAGNSLWLSFNGSNLLMALFSRGSWAEVAEMLPDEELHPLDGNIMLWWAVSAMLGRACGTEPRLATGELVDTLVGDSAADQSWFDLCQALLEDQGGDPGRASALARTAVEGLNDYGGLWDDLPFVWPLAVDLAMAAGDVESLDALMALAAQSDRTAAIPLALRAHVGRTAGVLARARGDQDEAEGLLRAAVDDFASWGSAPYGARARADLAGCLHDLGRDDEAASMLEPALATLRELGANAWLEELDPAFAADTTLGRVER
jgi:class 3 adenylate cyclase/tetratricopeptide (TPR) repeat protein